MSGPHLDDEAMSAVLDGEADAADLDHAESCEECASKLSAWRDAISMLKAASAPAATDARRTEAIEAALAALAALDVPAVADLAEHRRRRIAALNRGRVAAAAAAVAAVAGLAVGATQLNIGGSPKASTASRAPAATTNAQPSASGVGSGVVNGLSGNSGAASTPAAPNAAVASPLADLGKVSGLDQIARLLREQLAHQPTYSAQHASAGTLSTCEAAARRAAGAASSSVPVLEATLTYQGRPYLASVFPGTAKGTYVYAVVADPGCSLLTRGSFS